MEQLHRGARELSQGGQEVKHPVWGSLRERAGGSGGEEAKHSPPTPTLSKEVLVKIKDL